MSQLFISRMPKMSAIPQLVSAPLNPIPIAEHFRRMPEKQTGIWTVLNCARSCFFYQHANHLPVRLLSIKLKYPDSFTTFRFASSHFLLFFCKLNSFMWIYAFKRKKTLEETLCFQQRRFVSISLHLHLCKLPFIERISVETKTRLPFWAPFIYFDYQDFISWASFQRFNAGKLWEML